MAQTIDARVKQKTGVAADFAGFTLLEGEIALVRSTADGPVINYKVGPGLFDSLPWSLQVPGAIASVNASTDFDSLPAGLYLPEEDGTYDGTVSVDLTEGVTYLNWDGSILTKQVYPINLSGYATTDALSEKVSFGFLFDEGANLFNIGDPDVATGYFINSSGGITGGSPNYNTTGYIPVSGLTEVSVSFVRFYAFYDASKAYVPGSYVSHSPQGQATIAVPSGAAYLRVSTPFTAVGGIYYWDDLMVNAGDTQLPFEPYVGDKIKDEFLPPTGLADGEVTTPKVADGAITTPKVVDESITESKLSFAEQQPPGPNLANPDDGDVAIGQYLTSGGGLNSNAIYNTTGFIPVNPSINPEVTVSSRRFSAFYDASKTFISGSYVSTSGTDVTMEIPVGASFMRVTTPVADWSDLMVNYGDSILPYEPYYPSYWLFKGVKAELSGVSDEFLLFLPDEICIAVGRTIEIYHRQVAWCGNIDNYHFFWQGAGRSMKRKWSMTGESGSIGEYPLTLTVYDNNMVQVATATTTVKVVSDTISAPFTLMAIGDSLTNNKAWQPELLALSSGQISYEGTRGPVQVSPARTHEGRSGATAAWYLADSTYTFDASGQQGIDGRTQDKNPFWNPNTEEFDFGYYKSNYDKDPDKAMIFLGTNGMNIDPTANANNIKAIVDGLRDNDASLPIFVVLTLYRGGQNGLGNQTGSDGYVANAAWKLHEDREVFNLQQRVYDLLSGYSDLWFIPLSLCHDSEYNYYDGMVPVNPRAVQEEYDEVEATHPREQGYLQMADIMFSALAAHQ